MLDVVVPVCNEESTLEPSVLALYARLRADLPYSFRITIADNASTDETWAVAQRLASTIPFVTAVRLQREGRGGALREVWAASDAHVLAYLDVDLSSDLAAVLPAIAPLVSGHSDLVIGTRLSPTANVVRGVGREFAPRGCNLLLRTTLGARFTDAQCGFTAIRADRARELLPLVQDNTWFFDTELPVLAERAGLRIHDVPVGWVDDADSHADRVNPIVADLKGVVRLGWKLGTGRASLASIQTHARRHDPEDRLPGQIVRFVVVGAASILAYLVLYLLLRLGLSAQWANGLALLLTSLANTGMNRRLMLGIASSHNTVRRQAPGLAVFGLGLALTSGALLVLTRLSPTAPRAAEVMVLVTANIVAILLRFVLLRRWASADRPNLGSLPADSDQESGDQLVTNT